MSGIERALERERPNGRKSQVAERALMPRSEAPPGEPAGERRADAYGCVEWFDYCPVPRKDTRRR